MQQFKVEMDESSDEEEKGKERGVKNLLKQFGLLLRQVNLNTD